MTGDSVVGSGDKRKIKRDRGESRPGENHPGMVSISFLRAGEWLPADELRLKALQALQTDKDVTLDLAGADHLDGSALQILLAMALDRREKGLCLHLANTSPVLRQWFEYAGAPSHLSPASPGQP